MTEGTENTAEPAPVHAFVMRCDLCRWWRRIESDDHPDDMQGLCHRYPPQMNAAAIYFDTKNDIEEDPNAPIDSAAKMWHWAQPVTIGCSFCGEFASA